MWNTIHLSSSFAATAQLGPRPPSCWSLYITHTHTHKHTCTTDTHTTDKHTTQTYTHHRHTHHTHTHTHTHHTHTHTHTHTCTPHTHTTYTPHTHTHPARLLRMTDQFVAEAASCTTYNVFHALNGIRIRNPTNWAVAGLRLEMISEINWHNGGSDPCLLWCNVKRFRRPSSVIYCMTLLPGVP